MSAFARLEKVTKKWPYIPKLVDIYPSETRRRVRVAAMVFSAAKRLACYF